MTPCTQYSKRHNAELHRVCAEPVVCHKPYKKGGACVGLNRCQCAKGFTGGQCETAVTTPCVPLCQHGPPAVLTTPILVLRALQACAVRNYYIKNRQQASFPPGPRALPIVGNIFSVDHSRTHESMTQLSGKYGDVFSLRMGQKWMVVLNGFGVLKEALVNQGDSFSDRPPLPLYMDIFNGLGVVLSNGHLWKQQRRFALSTLRNFGLGKKTLEPVILDELTYRLKKLKS
ncbi:cytochrome P450 2H2-like [Cheilinus undulatus]|uniref:cytochrome P450 2H2-like n=1 Tax=Cheilinus undulatus TaxID=241271 RepID=UPI001BD62E9A|nr:cytochrome P450 2H2-like [Cheilinus undulatus]XP_041647496.1 cytochrome P450 2H2-like [Cheilinus undulatus]